MGDTRWSEGLVVWMQVVEKHEMFQEPNNLFGSVLCNILYGLVE